VPPRDWAEGSQRPVYLYRPQYPHLVTEERGNTWKMENLVVDDLDQRGRWEETQPIGFIPQVNHTHGLLEAVYGIANDQGVAIGESTSAATFFSSPRPALEKNDPEENTGRALFDVSELSKVCLERASTAVECIKIMGSLAEEHGYYGSEWSG
ncbi:unnamed protein product, partial [Discosporangium mesarthrocarpum]